MILHSLSSSLRKQDWATVLVEIVIVVVGVFLGIQASNWNAARYERAQEQDFLIRLHEDITESEKGQARDIAFLDQELADQAVIIDAFKACNIAEDDSVILQRGISSLGFINPPRIFRRTIDEMAAAGKLDIIENDAIKESLGAIVAMVEWRATFYDTVSRRTERYRYIIEEQVVYDFERTYEDPFRGQFVGVNFDIQKLCQNPKALSAISAISNITQERRRAYILILELYQSFLPILEEELRARWAIELKTESESMK